MSAGTLSLRDMVRKRAGNRCEMCGVKPPRNTPGKHRGSVHHRKMRRLGGQDTLSNLVLLCIPCHQRLHGNEPLAALTGWVAWSDPEVTPLRLASGRWALLVPDGAYEPLTPAEAVSLLEWVNGSAMELEDGLAYVA